MIARRSESGLTVTRPNWPARWPEWGPERVPPVQRDAVTIAFRGLPTGTAGDAAWTTRVRAVQLVPPELRRDPWPDAIPPIRDGPIRLPKPPASPARALRACVGQAGPHIRSEVQP